jgi:hypothetical protein
MSLIVFLILPAVIGLAVGALARLRHCAPMPARRVLTVRWRCVLPVAGGRPIVGHAVTASTG